MKIRFPILVKLTLLISLLLVSIALVIAWKNSAFFDNVSIQREESSNLKDVKTSAYQVETLLKSYIEKITYFSLDMLKEENEIELTKILIQKFNNDQDFLGLEIYTIDQLEEIRLRSIMNKQFALSQKLKHS